MPVPSYRTVLVLLSGVRGRYVVLHSHNDHGVQLVIHWEGWKLALRTASTTLSDFVLRGVPHLLE